METNGSFYIIVSFVRFLMQAMKSMKYICKFLNTESDQTLLKIERNDHDEEIWNCALYINK